MIKIIKKRIGKEPEINGIYSYCTVAPKTDPINVPTCREKGLTLPNLPRILIDSVQFVSLEN